MNNKYTRQILQQLLDAVSSTLNGEPIREWSHLQAEAETLIEQLRSSEVVNYFDDVEGEEPVKYDGPVVRVEWKVWKINRLGNPNITSYT